MNQLPIRLAHLIIRVPKNESAFTYFQLEARDGLCFYSTLDHEVGAGYRDIDIKCTLEFKNEVMNLINLLRNDFEIEILTDEEIDDE